VIYIDPPYNTGNKDFIYNDSFVDKEDSYRHSKRLSFINKRLKLAKNLLSDKGVIFISIDDNEQAPLKLLCDDIFGEENFVTQFIWEKIHTIKANSRLFSVKHDYISCYAKNISNLEINSLKRSSIQLKEYKNPDNDIR
jgi:adenine-specific DNA-methyltransferase